MDAKWASALTMFTKKYSPEILSGLAVAGVITTAVLAVRATPKALADIEEKREEDPGSVILRRQIAGLTWKYYVPAGLSAVATIACIAGASRIGSRRNTALVAGMALADRAFQEYKEEVREIIGERKELLVQEKVAEKRIEGNPAGKQVIITGPGEQLCYDMLTDRYFRGDMETIRRSENDINRAIIHDMYASQNDFYALIGLDSCLAGDELGWNMEHLLKLVFTAHLTKDGIPCIAIGYETLPVAKYGQIF